jgi:hypothetical protein
MKSITLVGLILTALILTALGCADRTHLTPEYGKSFHEFQARQTANPGAGEKDIATKGLDTQEAAMISHGYRASLASKGQEVSREPGLLEATSAQKKADYSSSLTAPQERQ